ncbi:MAG: transcription termination/antitermination protein NusA, partial [Methanomicrobia archaeon]|nr:transcription termination/antitermination protein NusA [Methanomicrobia archaeon]
MNSKDFIKALAELATSKGIAPEIILDALKEAMEKAYIKQLNAGDDALVKVEIDPKKGIIEMFQLKTIVEEVQDDFIEINLEEARKYNPNYQLGEFFRIPVSIEEITKFAALVAKQILRQKIAEAEKAALYEIYQDKIGEMINGVVEKVDERSAIVNLGRTSVY